MSGTPKNDIKVGDVFGDLTVIELIRSTKTSGYFERKARCKCSCGRIATPTETRLRQGKAKACRSCITSRAWQKIPRLPPEQIKLRIIEKQYRQRAKKRNLIWLLSQSIFRNLITQPCTYCGETPANGLDRRDNSKGYDTLNAVPCCSKCNYAKRDMSEKDFFSWIIRIAKFQGFSL